MKAVWLCFALAATAVVGSVDEPGASTAYRVTSTIKPVVFPLPGGAGQVVMAANSTVTVDGRRPNGPWKVTVEEGEVAMRLTRDSVAGGSSLEGGTPAVSLAAGATAWRWRRASTGVERAGLVDAVSAERLAILRTFDAGAAVRFSMSIPPSAGKHGPTDPSVEFRPLVLGTTTVYVPEDRTVNSAEKLTSHRERLMISTKGKGLAGPGVLVDFSGGKGDQARNVVVTGAVGKVKFFMKPSWQVTLAPRTVLELDSTEGEALKGAPPRVKLLKGAMMCEERPGATPATTTTAKLDGVAVEGNATTVYGNKQIVFAAPRSPNETDSQATMASAMRELNPVEPQPSDGGAGNVAVAMLALKSEMQSARSSGGDGGAAKLGMAASVFTDVMKTQANEGGGVFGGLGEKMVNAHGNLGQDGVGQAASVVGQQVANTVVKDGGRSMATASVTLMGELPATPKALSTMVPVQANIPGKEPALEVSMMARMPQGREGMRSRALEAVEKSADGTELPVALVVPKDLPADPGPDPTDYKVQVHPSKRDKNAKSVSEEVAETERAWRGQDRKSLEREIAPNKSRYTLGFVIGGSLLALLLLTRGGRIVELSQELILGTVTRRCERCSMILDQHQLAEIGQLEEQGPLFALLGFDDITEAHRQTRTREALLAWARQLKANAGSDRLQVRAHWCQRCIEGVFVCEMVGPNGVRDESSCAFINEDTRSMVLSVSRREAGHNGGVRV